MLENVFTVKQEIEKKQIELSNAKRQILAAEEERKNLEAARFSKKQDIDSQISVLQQQIKAVDEEFFKSIKIKEQTVWFLNQEYQKKEKELKDLQQKLMRIQRGW